MLGMLKKKISGLKFRNKLVVYYVLMALVPFTIYSIISASVFFGQSREMSISHTTQMTKQVSNSIDVYISGLDKLADTLARYLQRDIAAKALMNSTQSQYNIDYMLGDAQEAHPELAGILVANADSVLYSTGMTRLSRDSFEQDEWYRQAVQNGGKMVLISNVSGRNIASKKDYSTDEVFSLSKAIYNQSGTNLLGVILFDVRHDIIRDSISKVTIGENGFVFVLDEADNVVYADSNEVVYRVNPRWMQGVERFNARILGQEYQLVGVPSNYSGWKTVGVFSLREIMGSATTLGVILFLVVVVTLLLVIILSVQMAKVVTKPISKLQGLMKQAESGDLSARFVSRYDDEIGQLGNSFNHMIEQIDQLIEQVYHEQQSKRDAEIKILQEQIKPHFLYNTLDSISWMAREYNAQDIVKLVDALTNMFRIGLSQGRDYITIREEITHVTNYLYIQKIRYKDKLEYVIHADEQVLECYMPKMLLQPLVENAIYHGIKQKRGGGHIRIDVGQDTGADNLVLCVADDGAGMDEDTLENLRRGLEDTEIKRQSSFGLFYIKERVLLSYKKPFKIEIDSEKDAGARVKLTLPREVITRQRGEPND